MKIAMVFDGLQIGGIERVGADYAKLLIELGHEVTVFNLVPSLSEMESLYPKECRFVHINFPRKICPEQYNKIMRWKSWGKWVYPPVSLALSGVGLIYKAFLKKYRACRERFDLAIAFAGHYNDLTFVASDYINARHKLCWLHGSLNSYILISDGFINLYKKIKNLIVLTRDCEVEALAYNSFLKLNINQLHNPVVFCDKKYSDKKVESLKSKYGDYILMASRMEMPHKRPDIVIDAFEICYLEYGLKSNLVFVGDGPDLDIIKEYANNKDKSVAEHIFFEGSRHNIEDYYKSAVIFIQSSSYEGLPTTIIEALQSGIPVVASDCHTGPREILGDNEYGLLCKVEDEKDMAKKIYQIVTDKELANHYIKVGKQRGNDFSPEVIKGQLENILKKFED